MEGFENINCNEAKQCHELNLWHKLLNELVLANEGAKNEYRNADTAGVRCMKILSNNSNRKVDSINPAKAYDMRLWHFFLPL